MNEFIRYVKPGCFELLQQRMHSIDQPEVFGSQQYSNGSNYFDLQMPGYCARWTVVQHEQDIPFESQRNRLGFSGINYQLE
jgi:hypothetical protein